jgi:hypothetical protein
MAVFYRVTIRLSKNEDLVQAFRLHDDAAAPLDLTGADIAMRLSGVESSDSLDLSVANGRIAILDAQEGEFELRVPTSALAGMTAGVYRHDLILTQSDRRLRIWDGTLTLDQGVSP